MHGDLVQGIVTKSFDLSLRGCFDEALALIHAQKSSCGGVVDRHELELLRAEARIHVHRGHARKAQQCIEKALQLELSGLPHIRIVALNIHVLFIQIVCCGSDIENVGCIDEAERLLADMKTLTDFDHDAVEMVSQIYRIQLLRRTLCRRASATTSAGSLDRIKTLLEEAVGARRWVDLYRLSIPFCIDTETAVAVDWLENVLLQEALPSVFEAEFNITLFEKLINTQQFVAASNCLDKAEQAFCECDHAFGLLEVKRLRLQHGMLTSPNMLAQFIDIINVYIGADHPHAALRAAISPLTLAYETGNYRAYVLLQEAFSSIAQHAGLKHEHVLLRNQLLATLNIGASHFAKVLELGKPLFEDCKHFGYWTVAYYVGQLLSLAYLQASDPISALQLANEIYHLTQDHDLANQGEAVLHLVTVQASRPTSSDADYVQQCCDVIQTLDATIAKDVELGNTQLACQKLHLKAQMQYQISTKESSEGASWAESMCATIDAGRALANALEDSLRLDVNGNCDDLMVTYLLSLGRKQGDLVHENRAIQLCNNLISAYRSRNNSYRIAMKSMIRAVCYQQIFQKEADLAEKGKILVQAEGDFKIAVQHLEELQFHQQLLIARHGQARIYMNGWLFYGIPDTAVFEILQLAEATADAQRRELSTIGGLGALLAKQRFSSNPQLADIYSWAVQLSLQTQQLGALWRWSQKRKARSLSDMLGLGINIPRTVTETIRKDRNAAKAFETLISLKDSLKVVSESERTYIRQHIEDAEATLRQHPSYGQFSQLRDGYVTDLSQLESLAMHDRTLKVSRRVIFIEWIIHQGRYLLLSFDCHKATSSGKVSFLSLTEPEVASWLKENFGSEQSRKECLRGSAAIGNGSQLRLLDPLVAPISHVAAEGDLLVLSTTGNLSHVPLHVLEVVEHRGTERKPLIERHPVVYVPSFSALQLCVMRSIEHTQTSKSVHLGVFFDHPQEAKAISRHMLDASRTTKGTVFWGEEVTRTTFARCIDEATLIHFHGHCRFQSVNKLDQSLILASQTSPLEGPAASSASSLANDPKTIDKAGLQQHVMCSGSPSLLQDAETSQSQHLTVEDIFRLDLASPLVLLIACASASQQISNGDEPLGLIAGLLCAGASSVIGASWPIPSGTGRAFSDVFFEQMARTEGSFMDVAVAVQEAVLTMRDDMDMAEPYDWGAFSLHGSWLYKI